ncbi:Sec-independent protein translocase protein TatB [Oceanimonas sp. NS1]|uniref:Sec-independent protein translocase protein TatB n=1 Tax=Oceanimonas doudoroffii TaxID=84158 RepID=A0A233RBY8_9GAMM|nr:Sec-independent protein translocase protein TatB [Oceanimonas sp. NS1]NHI00990.1 Sec-independent protein translocase protein TatB [Oceanimonas sp. MB9]OXY80905.1 twin-arginine translocase subunit TatB [Oceanimonas doudoroffii]
MFDIGFWELVVISVIGLVVLGPERLPVAIRTVSRLFSTVRNTANAVKTELAQELKMEELHRDLKKAEQLGMKDLSPELQQSIDQLKDAAASVNRPYEKRPEQNTDEPSSTESRKPSE